MNHAQYDKNVHSGKQGQFWFHVDFKACADECKGDFGLPQNLYSCFFLKTRTCVCVSED